LKLVVVVIFGTNQAAAGTFYVPKNMRVQKRVIYDQTETQTEILHQQKFQLFGLVVNLPIIE
jgi:hypothetical protein